MTIEYLTLASGELPLWDWFRSPTVHIWVPRRGWKPSSELLEGRSRVLLPLTGMQPRRLRRWVDERIARYPHPGVFFGVVVRDLGDYVTVGLAHDTE